MTNIFRCLLPEIVVLASYGITIGDGNVVDWMTFPLDQLFFSLLPQLPLFPSFIRFYLLSVDTCLFLLTWINLNQTLDKW